MAAIGGNADDPGAAKASAGLMETAQRLEAGTAHFGGALGGAALGFALLALWPVCRRVVSNDRKKDHAD
jgi:hypothetical protein